MRTIYITPAGKTAAHHIDEYFRAPIQHFGPLCGIVLLTSPDVRNLLEDGVHAKNYDFPTDIVETQNPFSSNADYYEIMSDLMDAVANIAEAYQDDNTPIRCVVNCSGGTTKMTMWMFDLAILLSRIFTTKTFFATYDPNKAKVVFTERPMLNDRVIKDVFGENHGKEKQE